MSEPTQSDDPQAEDASSLVPALLTIVAAYATYKAVQGQINRDWRAIAAALNFGPTIGRALEMIYLRTIARMREDAGRGGDELLTIPHAVIAAEASEAGYKTIADALVWMDTLPPERQHTKDYAEDGVIPTREDPPTELAEMVAQAVASTTMVEAGRRVGWRYKVWLSMRDNQVRYTHMQLHGVKISLGEQFVSPSGARLDTPGDPNAPIAERINCRCSLRITRS